MLRKVLLVGATAYVLAAVAWVIWSGVVRDTGEVELLNVACDPTRELWAEVNDEFVKRYDKKVTLRMSHGGSGSQARSVAADGLRADVVTLALWTDTDAVRKAGLISDGWESRLPNRSLPYTSTIVFLVRKGNPKNLHNWDDLTRDGVQVVTPNPKTSGNGKWSFLAIWGYALRSGLTEEQTFDFTAKVYANVKALDTAARAASQSFVEKKNGDVLLTWENEAYLDRSRHPADLDIVYPATSVLAEPHVAVVDQVVDEKGTREVAEDYLKFLFTKPAQEIIGRHYYRPVNLAYMFRGEPGYDTIQLFPATICAPTWDDIQKKFFAEGAMFDRIQASRRGR